MDYMQQQQQWRNPHHLSAHPPSAKIPKLLLDQNQPSDPASATAAAAGLSLSVQQPTNSSSKNSSLSAFPDPSMTSFPRMGIGFFSLAQWKELELQALIFKYILAGAPVPVDLVLRVRKSLLNSTAFYQHHPGFIHPHEYQHYQTAVLQTGCWGRSIVDSEPGRCRRTDGKKWRCSRDVMSGQKYCERHVHRGRNRSRKPVEVPTPSAAANAGVKTNSIVSMLPAEVAKEVNFTLSGPLPSSNDLFHLNQRSSNDGQTESGPYRHVNQDNVSGHKSCGGGKSDVRVLRHFFDDWPRSQQEPSSTSSNASPATSSTHLSISIQGNQSSDFSLKLSTGDDELGVASGNANDRRTNWAGWGAHHEASMGGPLAEALRSSTSNASPTSVLHKPYGSISETSSICT